MRSRIAPSVMIMFCMCAGLQGCQVFGRGPIMPNLGGVYVAHDAYAEADEKIADEISASFKQAEEALRRGDLEGVLAFYAKGYTHKGFNAVTIGSTWKDLLQKNRELSITLVFERIIIEPGRSPPKAQVICTGGLWGVSRVTGRRHHLESWFDEVYHLVYENGRWRTQGHAWEVLMEKETRSARPPHPFF